MSLQSSEMKEAGFARGRQIRRANLHQRKLVILSPYGLPGTNGLSDHVDQIISALNDCDLPSIKIGVAASAGHADTSLGIVSREDSKGLDQLLSRVVTANTTLVLHYVGYGYHRRGYPISLVRTLQRLRSTRRFRLVSVLHELYASGWPWTSTFYFSAAQRWVFRALLRLSDTVVTSTPKYQRIVEAEGKAAGIHPVVSNIGEPEAPPQLQDRWNQAVVFGLPNSRRQLLESGVLESSLPGLRVERVLEIGRPTGQAVPHVPGVKWEQCGELSSGEVSQIFLQSRYGLLRYPRNLLSKSGVFAAYAAHRLVPVLLHHSRRPIEELYPNVHYLDASCMGAMNMLSLQEIADACWGWYVKERSVPVCTNLYLGWCRP